MTPEPRSPETIFCEAIEIESPEDRSAFLASACQGDPLLLREVEELVANHFGAGDFLEKPACGVTVSLDDPLGEKLGERIGPYKLLEEIGEGGFGVVYMAEQEEPVCRRVALKVIKPGMDTRQVIARFEAERQALALMDHPNVARVLDAGATEGGRPYFVMDLIKGLPITEYSDQASLSTLERLDLFLQVCQGVQHAHQKGIIHRDIKPSNVLVTLHDSRAVPKVIDFGVAKAIHHRLTERTLFTGYAQLVGTPLYMSPEQAVLSGLDVDTRSDIYSLGVLLYELLTGTRPLEPSRLGNGSSDDIRRVICEEEPPTPSQRIATTEAGELKTIAARRRIEPRRLQELLHGDLDWITMKALEKDRTARYETASAFAADVERYLADEPVEARPPSRWYRARKFARRNRGTLAAVLMAALALLVALGGVAGSVGWSLRERAERVARIGRDVEAALEESRKLRQEAWSLSEQPSRLEAKLAAAFSALRRARSLLGDTEGPGESPLEARVKAVEADLEADEQDRLMMATLDRIYRKKLPQFDFNQEKFLYPLAIAEYRDAFDRYGIRRGSTSPEEAAAAILGRREPVREELLAALDDWLGEGPGEPDAGWISSVLAAADRDEWRKAVRAARAAGDREALEALAQRPDAARQRPGTLGLLGNALLELGASDSSIAVARRAQDLHPGNARVNLLLAKRLGGKSPEAITHFRIAVALLPGDADAHFTLGSALHQQGDLAGAVASYEKAIHLDPDHAIAHYNLGALLAGQGDHAGAARYLRKVIELKPDAAVVHNTIGRNLAAQDDLAGAIASYRRAIELKPDLAEAHLRLGLALKKQGDLPGAISSYRKAIELDADMGEAHCNLGVALVEHEGDLAGAISSYEKAIELKRDHDCAHYNLGNALGKQGDHAGAISSYRKAIQFKPDYAAAHHALGNALIRQGDLAGAIASYEKTIELDPSNVVAHNNLGIALSDKGDLAGAISSYRKAIDLKADYVVAHNNLGTALLDEGDRAGAIASYRRAIELGPDLIDLHVNMDLALRVEGDPSGASAPERVARDSPAAYRVYKEALRLRPEFLGGPILLYTAARLAALAAMASRPDAAEDAAALDLAERARFRGEAEEWLRALAGRSGDPQALAALRNIFHDAWRNPYLASLRDPPELEKLPAEEAARFRALWADLTRVAIDVLERLLDRGDRTVEPELRELRRSLLPDLPTFASIDDAIEHDPDESSFVAFRRAAGEAGAARLAYLDGRLLQLRGEHERALAKLEKAMGAGAPEPVVRAVECLRALGREAEAEARLRLALAGNHERLERLWLESQGRQARSLEEILRGWPEGARPPIELPPVRDDASLRAVPLDLGPHFNRDVVADAGDDENDFVDSAARLVVFTVGEGGIVRGLPPDRAIGVHRLGDYAAKNALQLSRESRESVRFEVPRGRYREVRFLLTGGHGDSMVPLRLEYADGRRVSAEIPCADWFQDAADGLPGGLVSAWNGMDFWLEGRLERAGDPALFEWTLGLDGDADLVALELDPGAGRFFHAGTRFNLFAVTVMAGAE